MTNPGLLALAVVAMLAACDTSNELSDTDRDAIRAAALSYSAGWLTNDADAVMQPFVAEPVLSPSGLPWLEGQQAARDFWFPANGSATAVTKFDQVVLETGGSGDLGFVRGTFELAFVYDGTPYESGGKFVSLLRRQPDGAWKITHQVWDDYPRRD